MKIYYQIKYKIKSFFSDEVKPPSYEFKREQINRIKNKYNLNVLVETGTFLGDTVENFKSIFRKVISIELSEHLVKKAQKRFENDNNVSIIQGDSGDVLKNLIKEIDEPVLFWLDGHYSSEFFVGKEFIQTARGLKDTPIEKELQVLLNCPLQHIILIDDARLFTGQNDYPSLSRIRKIVKKSSHSFKVFIEQDIINIIPST